MGRLKKESQDITDNFKGILEHSILDDSQMIWHVKFQMPAETVYAGESYTLQFKFDSNYPIEAPEVIFVGTIPHHEHVYLNGYICLSTLYSDWTPALKVSSVTMSIISMLSSAKAKSRPANDESASAYMSTMRPKQVTWMFEDEHC